MAMLLDATDTMLLRESDLEIGPYIFLRAFEMVCRSPWLAKELTKNGEPLYALPGGGVATEASIRAALRAAS